MITRSKVQGMMLGIAFGDALGMPVETWSRQEILAKYPQGITKFEKPDGHKWFTGQEAGTTTDDTQLSLAVMRGCITGKYRHGSGYLVRLEDIAKTHVEALKESTSGWGNTTREACIRLANGVSPYESGYIQGRGKSKGSGNGVLMKMAPLTAVLASSLKSTPSYLADKIILDFNNMTHYTKLAAYAALYFYQMLLSCLLNTPQKYDALSTIQFVTRIKNPQFSEKFICRAESRPEEYSMPPYEFLKLNESSRSADDLAMRLFEIIRLFGSKDLTKEWIAKSYSGSCFVYDSLPYVIGHWMLNNQSVDCLYDSINYGGDRNDTDTNASMLGALLGALHGVEIWEPERHLIENLKCYEEVIKITDEFCDTFNIT